MLGDELVTVVISNGIVRKPFIRIGIIDQPVKHVFKVIDVDHAQHDARRLRVASPVTVATRTHTVMLVIAVTPTELLLPIRESRGDIWMLDQVYR